MSLVDYDSFLNWAVDRFGEANIKYRKGGQEICTHSFFVDGHPDYPDGDHKFKLWMNPEGGKKELEGGAYRCWYTDNMGSLISLVSLVDKIPYDEAADLICSEIPLRALEKKVHEFYNFKEENEEPEPEKIISNIELPEFSYKITELDSSHYMNMRATKYLDQRKIPYDDFYVCVEGDYKNRIVIPYYDQDGKLVYYNARLMSDNKNALRYMKPDPEDALQENVLYFPKYPKPGQKVYVTEGEFDAYALWLAGFYGVACGGKFITDAQVELLRPFKVVLCFDTDGAGKNALVNNGDNLLSMGITDLSYVRPPKSHKDWNELLIQRGPDTIRAYVNKFEKPYGSWTSQTLLAQGI